MAELTPLNSFPIPVEHEEPYFATILSYFLATDQAHWAHAENSNLIWAGGGNFSWSALSGTLTWGEPITVTPKTTPYKAIIQGPPLPFGQVTLQDGQVAFFKMPRSLVADQIVTLETSTLAKIPGTRLHDIKIFAARIGDTIFLPEGRSLKDAESGELFGAGLGTTIPPHEHQPALVIEPPFVGTNTLDLNIASFSPQVLKRVRLFRNGAQQTEGEDYSVDLTLGIVTLFQPTVIPNERFVAFRITTVSSGSSGVHQHLAPRVVTMAAGATQIDCLVTSLDDPALTRVDVYRGGQLLADPDDYTIDLTSGLITLAVPAVLGERVVVQREVE